MVSSQQKPASGAKVIVRATARRKCAIAQALLQPGSGKIVVNGRDVNDFFPYAILVQDLTQGLEQTEVRSKYDVSLKTHGGGFAGQSGACRLAICRALVKINPGYKAALRKLGLMTCDARVKERKKYGLLKARRAPQFSKR